jgi:AcrR family transcriptional regulator
MADVKRPYDAPRRDAAARLTRRSVLDAARDLFVEQGWATTTVSQIAERAAVSRPTVFAVGSKAELLALARDLALAGDDEAVAVFARQGVQTLLAEPAPVRTVELVAAHVVRLQLRYAPLDAVLQAAAGADEQCRTLWQTSEAQRRAGAQLFADNLAGKGPLALPLDRAVDVLWVFMASDPYRRLVLESGWTVESYQAWLGGVLRAQLLPVG